MLTLAIYLAGVLAASEAFPQIWPSAVDWPSARVAAPAIPRQESQSQCANGQCRPEAKRFQSRRRFQWKSKTK
jgi:hypothetical protein